MTRVSDLSREIASEIMAITGRNISVEDYLRIRDKAVFEVENGLYEATTITSSTMESIYSPTSNANSIQEQSVSQNKEFDLASTSVPASDLTPAATIVSEKKLYTKPKGTKKITSFNVTPTDSEEDDPFFAMCDKL